MFWLINITEYSNATADISLKCKDQQSLVLWSCVTAATVVFGFPGAVAILLDMFQKGRKETPFTPNDVFVLNLTIMDGIFLLSFQRDLLNYLHVHNLVYKSFIFFLYSFNFCGRPLFITCICLDCYLAVVHPVTYRARKSLTPRILMAVSIWTVTVAYGCYFAIVREEVLNDITPVIFFVWTLPVIGFCDFSILWTLKRSSPGGRDIHPQKKRAVQIILNNLVITFITYLPPIITLLVSKFQSLDRNTFRCLVVIPMMHVNVLGNIVSLFVYLNNLGKLDWLRCWKLK